MNVPKLAWFKFGDSYSYDYGIWTERLPDLLGAVRRSDRIHIPGRGDMVEWLDDYVGHVMILECAILNTSQTDNIIRWLQGDGRLIFSHMPQYYYKASMRNEGEPIRFVQAVGKAYRFMVSFDCEPYKYSVDEINDAVSFPGGSHRLHGKGNAEAEPVVTVRGSGNIVLTVNGNAIQLNNISGHVTLDMGRQWAHKDGEALNDRMAGRFCKLRPGENIISTTGNVQRVEIVPNWRWL